MPTVVVLPVPLIPTNKTTALSPCKIPFLSSANCSVIRSVNKVNTELASGRAFRLASSLSESIISIVAGAPMSADINASSSPSQKSSSRLGPLSNKTLTCSWNLVLVLLKPELIFSKKLAKTTPIYLYCAAYYLFQVFDLLL